MKNSKLEKVLEYLINKEEDKARDLLHQVFIEKAREIHESLMQEDDLGLEDDDDIGDMKDELENEELAFEEYFSEEDLEGGDADADDAEDEDGDADAAADDLGDDLLGGEEDDAAEDDAAVDGGEDDEMDLRASIEELQAEFERIQQQLGMDDAEGDDEGDDADDDLGLDAGDEDDLLGGDADEDDMEPEEGDDDEEEETSESASIYDDFDDLAEAAVDDLEKVNVSMTHSGIGKGEKVNANDTSPIPQRKRNDRTNKAKPHEVKGSQHKGYDREAAPGSKAGTGAKSPSNVKGKADEGRSKVARKGDDSAKLNSKEGFGDEGKESPLSKMGSKSTSK